MQLSSTKAYGRLVLAVVLMIGLWSVWNTQQGIHYPGWLAGLRATVWCRTVLVGPEFGNTTFFHYPGKQLQRLMDEMQVPPRYQALYLEAEQEDITCYASWKEAAAGDIMFYTATQDYPKLIEEWVEADYQRALLMLHLQPQGFERLEALMQSQQRLMEQEANNPQ